MLAELSRITPEILILLGATAGRSLLGRPISVTADPGIYTAPEIASRMILTSHPFNLLRILGDSEKQVASACFLNDLKRAA